MPDPEKPSRTTNVWPNPKQVNFVATRAYRLRERQEQVTYASRQQVLAEERQQRRLLWLQERKKAALSLFGSCMAQADVHIPEEEQTLIVGSGEMVVRAPSPIPD